MAFRKSALQAVGGFDEQFRIAGDDVDICWKLQERGWTLGFNPAAVVWHHRRNSVRTFWKQQVNYGRAEADLERKWPQKYNTFGHATWEGRLYSKSMVRRLGLFTSPRIYHGTWGSAPFQSVAHEAPGTLASLPHMPEWWMVVLCLALASLIGMAWKPMLLAVPVLIVAAALPLLHAMRAARLVRREAGQPRRKWIKYWALTGVMHVMQPLARLRGRLGRGLTPWRRRGVDGFCFPWPRRFTLWSETWQSGDDRLVALESALRNRGAAVRRGGDFDRWDLELRAGILGAVRIVLVVEEHGQGKQLVRFRTWPKATGFALALIFALVVVSLVDWGVASARGAAICGIPAWLLAIRTAQECAAGLAAVKSALKLCEGRRVKASNILARLRRRDLGVPPPPAMPPARPARPAAGADTLDDFPPEAAAELAHEA
jgi:hypothetical protein